MNLDLKQLRLAAGLTVRQAAQLEGVSMRLWAYWEAGKNLPPLESEVRTLERLLGRWAEIAAKKP